VGGLYLQNQALFYAYNVTNLRITGSGVIDGRGQASWDAFRNQHRHNSSTALLSGGRPNLIQVVNSSRIEIDSVTLLDSPFWAVHPVLCQHVHVHHTTIRAPMYAPNVDGIDPDSCLHVLIEGNDVGCGDDHVAIKAGVCGTSSPNRCTDPVWQSGLYRTRNVTVRGNVYRTGMGIAVGSEMSGGVSDVYIYNNTVGVCDFGSAVGQRTSCGWGPAMHVKTTVARGGTMENIVFRDNTVFNTSMFIFLEVGYQTKQDELPPKDYAATIIRDIAFLRNRVVGRGIPATFACSRYATCHNVVAINNTLADAPPGYNPWGCHFVADDYRVANNFPPGLKHCMNNAMNATITGERFLPGNFHVKS
jgi:polygalacturonase